LEAGPVRFRFRRRQRRRQRRRHAPALTKSIPSIHHTITPSLAAFGGPYWIVAIDTANVDDPQWAIVAGGPPNLESNGKCLYPTEGFNGNGLWLFHREPIAPAEDVTAMRGIAADLGLDVTALIPVQQEGCLYEGAFDPTA